MVVEYQTSPLLVYMNPYGTQCRYFIGDFIICYTHWLFFVNSYLNKLAKNLAYFKWYYTKNTIHMNINQFPRICAKVYIWRYWLIFNTIEYHMICYFLSFKVHINMMTQIHKIWSIWAHMKDTFVVILFY